MILLEIVQNNAGISETIFVFKKRELQRKEKGGVSFGISGSEPDHVQTRDASSEMDSLIQLTTAIRHQKIPTRASIRLFNP